MADEICPVPAPAFDLSPYSASRKFLTDGVGRGQFPSFSRAFGVNKLSQKLSHGPIIILVSAVQKEKNGKFLLQAVILVSAVQKEKNGKFLLQAD
ncbi:MAG: hypothetical protein ACYST6_19815 [Planctomycetota bacterium]